MLTIARRKEKKTNQSIAIKRTKSSKISRAIPISLQNDNQLKESKPKTPIPNGLMSYIQGKVKIYLKRNNIIREINKTSNKESFIPAASTVSSGTQPVPSGTTSYFPPSNSLGNCAVRHHTRDVWHKARVVRHHARDVRY